MPNKQHEREQVIYSTHSAVIPPSESVRIHLRRCSQLADSLSQELSAAAQVSNRPDQSRRLGALSRACESLDFALASLRRNHVAQ